MKLSSLVLLFILLATSANAKVYKWVDENGTTHFSDKPNSGNAEEIVIRGTGITVQKKAKEPRQQPAEPDNKQQKINDNSKAYDAKSNLRHEEKSISEADYRITSSVGKLGADVISISGRIGSGPVCKDMTVTASVSNEHGLSATITQQTGKATSHGSTIFEGTAKVSGSRDDLSFWKIDSVTIRCND
ncbi:MAG: DUF4124 domain-containing protein [Methanothrix sp.]|nr:MAG: DUF4124 domain-containing protein [Methanothrix sp.]